MHPFAKSFLKKKAVWIYIGVICILLCICFFQLIMSRSVQEFDGGYVFAPEDSGTRTIFEDISLKPGVYQIILDYRTDQDYSAYCNIRDDSVNAGTLLTNGEHFYAGRAETTFYLWLFQSTDDLQVVADYVGGYYVETGNLLIRNTGKLWSIRFVLVCFAGALGMAGIAIFFYQKEYGIARETWLTGIVLVGIALMASLSQLGGYMYSGADLTYHLMRIEGVKDSILARQFPIRIEPEWLYGHGYASGIFYCDALFYLPALLRLAGFTITASYNVYCICLNFATAWIAWYCFGKIFRDNRIGLMCSGFYTLSIMRLYRVAIVNAIGEGSAITFLPLIFYGVYCIFAGKNDRGRKAWIPLVLGYTGIIQTHVLTCEITLFLMLLFCVICIRKVFCTPVFTALVKAVLAVIGLNFWYIVPFLDYYLTQDIRIRHASGRTIQDRGLYLSQMLVNIWSDEKIQSFEERGFQNVVALSPGYVGLLALVVFGGVWIWWKIAGRDMSTTVWRAAEISFVFALIMLCMTLQNFPWNSIQKWGELPAVLISSLQFPYRFLGWAMVFLTMLFGCCLWIFRKKRVTYLIGAVLALFSMCTAAYGVRQFTCKEDYQLRIYNEGGMGYGYISGAEYLIYGVDEGKLSFAGAVPGEHVRITEYAKQYLTVKLVCENIGSEESYIDFPLLYYKGYQAKTDTGEKLQVCYGDNYLVRVILPSGYSGGVKVCFVSPFYWRISELVTLLTIGVLCLYFKSGKARKTDLTGRKKRDTLTSVKRE